MDISLLKQLIIDSREAFLKPTELINREIIESFDSLIKTKQVVVVTGVRRSGKSSLLKLLARDLLKKGIKKDQIFYLNFEDEFFAGFKKEDFSSLTEAFYEVSELTKSQKIYCFFDEIQNIPLWEKWINKLHESDEFKVFISGSNSSLLSSEIATSLSGRSYKLELFPFSFREYLKYKKVPFDTDIEKTSTAKKMILKKEFNKYLLEGGLPLSINSDLNIFDDYYDNIIYKDIVARYGIKNIEQFRAVSLYLMSNISNPMTYRSLSRIIEGLESSMTAKNFVYYLCNAYMFFIVKKFDVSLRKQMANPFKVFCIDNGLQQNISFSLFPDMNKLFENLVFLTFRRTKKKEIYYFKDAQDKEVDFLVKEKQKIDLYQVSYNLNDPLTKKREVSGLLSALKNLNQKTGYIINDHLEKEEILEDKKIIFIPLWKWILKNQ